MLQREVGLSKYSCQSYKYSGQSKHLPLATCHLLLTTLYQVGQLLFPGDRVTLTLTTNPTPNPNQVGRLLFPGDGAELAVPTDALARLVVVVVVVTLTLTLTLALTPLRRGCTTLPRRSRCCATSSASTCTACSTPSPDH